MNRNDGGHNPHRPGYNRANNNKHHHHHHNRQNQQNATAPATYPASYHQIPPFLPIQQSPPVQTFPPAPFIQQDKSHQYQQQQYFNQPQQYLPHGSLANETNQIQNIRPSFTAPTITNPNTVILNTTNWFNPEVQVLYQPPMPPVDQTHLSNSSGQLQLPANQITEAGIIPNAPYYELPASLMVPLIAPSQRDYKPLVPSELRLPLPMFPDENFLRSIDSYYGSDGKTRDNDGWDRTFIDTYIGQKAALAESHVQP